MLTRILRALRTRLRRGTAYTVYVQHPFEGSAAAHARASRLWCDTVHRTLRNLDIAPHRLATLGATGATRICMLSVVHLRDDAHAFEVLDALQKTTCEHTQLRVVVGARGFAEPWD